MQHFLNSSYWRDIKRALGNKIFEVDGTWFQTTKLPLIGKSVAYIPRADLNKIDLVKLSNKAKEEGCIYLSIDPANQSNGENEDFINELSTSYPSLIIKKGRPTQLQSTVVIDLTKAEDQLLAAMKQKHRYNIKIAKKHDVKVEIVNTQHALDTFLKLHEQTVQRQNYNDRDSSYIKKVWEVLNEMEPLSDEFRKNIPKTFIATAYYNNEPLASWFLIGYEDTLYYPYGGSSEEYKNVMASYLLVWEVIKFGQLNGYKKLDLMGTLKDKSDGYSRFKAGFGGEEIDYKDTIDLVVDPLLYKLIKLFIFLRNLL